MEPAAPWQFLTGYYQYRQQLNSLTKLLNENNALPPLANFKDESGNEPRTLVLVIGESTQRGRMSLYGYPRETTPELDALHKTDPNLTVFNNVVTSRPYTIEILQQALTFANEKNPDLYLTQPSLMNMMKQAGYKTFWITNQQTMTARNTMLTVFSRQTDKQYYMNQQRTQSAREYDTNVLKPFEEVLKDPAPKKLIIVHLLGTHIKYKYRYPENQGKFDGNTDHVPPGLNAEELESYNDYDNANLYNDHVVASLIKDFKAADPNGFWFTSLTTVKRFTTRRLIKPGGVMRTTRRVICTPFRSCCGRRKNGKRLIPVISHRMSIVNTAGGTDPHWSDLAGLSYDGYDPTRSVVNPQFKETTRWIGNPYKKNALIDYDTLPYGDQVGNQ